MTLDFRRYVFSPPYFGWLCRGIEMTLLVTLATTVLSLALATLIIVPRESRSRPVRVLAGVYVNVFRNLPPIPLLLFLAFGLPGAFLALTGRKFPEGSEFALLIAGLSLNTSAYLVEILRSGLRGVPAGQMDSARVLGMSPAATRRYVHYPQALRIALPALCNRLIHNMKNSAVALVLPLAVGRMELMGQVGRIAGQTFAWAEPLVAAAVFYLLLTLAMSAVASRLSQAAQRRIELPQ